MFPYVAFLLSGLAALVLEIVFLRQLAWLFGSATYATALVLAAFMAGLALGAAAFGRLADRVERPLTLFGMLEIGVGVSGALLTWLLGEGRALFLAPLRTLPDGGGARAVEFALAFALLCVPTILMGGSLPALTRHTVRQPSRLLGPLGLLYGLNTLGGAVGVFLAGFYLFEMFGVSSSAYLAALLDVLVGGAALWLDRFRVRREPAPGETAHEAPTAPGPTVTPGVRAVCLAAVGLGGAAVLAYEVVWTRLLTLSMRSFSYSFSLMLSLFLGGLVLGALIVFALADRIRRPLRWFAACQLGMGAWVATSLLFMPALLMPAGASSFEGFLLSSVLGALPIVLPPTVLSGMALLLAVRGLEPARSRVGREVGLVYAFNTAGAIVGSLAAALLLLPTLGAPRSLSALAAINALAGLLVLRALDGSGARLQGRVAVGVVVACAATLALPADRFVRAFLDSTRSGRTIGELLYFHEGSTDSVAVVRRDYGFHDPEAKSLITNGIAMTATVKPVWRYMALEGHLPVLLAPEPKRALVIGVGTGITLGAVTSHAALETIDAVELSEGVLGGLHLFREESGDAAADPRVRLRRQDGRHFLELSEASYDLITLEPPPPIVAGSVHLYSLDFYRLCLEHLSEGGVVAQWLPLHAQSLASAQMTAATFLEAFEHVQLWMPSVRDAVLIGSAEELRLPLERLRAAYRDPRTGANLREALLETPEALLGTYLLDRTGVEAWANGAPTITDEHPRMEFFRNQGRTMVDEEIAGLLDPAQGGWGFVEGLAPEPEAWRRVETENAALRGYLRSRTRGEREAEVEAVRSSRGTEFFLYGHGCTTAQLDYLTGLAAAEMEAAARLAAQRQRCAQIQGTFPEPPS
jgi:spermidine synthase